MTNVDGPLGQVLLECASRNLSGTVHISGEPGGSVHLDRGGIVAVDTPGAPGPEVLLIRSGRVSEAAWSAAFTAAAANGEMGAELVRQRLVGAVRLEVVLRSALADAMFAVAAGQVDDCHVAVAGVNCMLPMSPGEQARWLLAETARRLGVLAALRSQLKPDREQVTGKATAPDPRFQLDDAQRDILALANGRRTARDMAFALGRGVYPVTLELDRMHNAALLTVTGRRGEAAKRSASLDGPLVPRSDAGQGNQAGDGRPAALPRRRAASRDEGTRPAPAPQSGSALFRVLRLGLGNPSGADEATDHQTGR